MLPAVTLGTIWAKPVSMGSAPRALTKSAWVDDDTRTRRPAKSARLRSGLPQKITCAGYTSDGQGLHPCWSRSAFQIRAKGGQRGAQGGNVGVQPRQIRGRVFGMLGRKRAPSAPYQTAPPPAAAVAAFRCRAPRPGRRERFLRCKRPPLRRASSRVPEGLFAAHILVEFGQTAHHTQVGSPLPGVWTLAAATRPDIAVHPSTPQHSAAAQRPKQSRQTRNDSAWLPDKPRFSLLFPTGKAEEHHPAGHRQECAIVPTLRPFTPKNPTPGNT